MAGRRTVAAGAFVVGSVASVEHVVPASGFFLLVSAFSLEPEVAGAIERLFVHALQMM